MRHEDPLKTIVQIMREATPAPDPRPHRPCVVVHGDGNVVAAGDVHLHVQSPPGCALNSASQAVVVARR